MSTPANTKSVTIIGGGPAGLMAAETLIQAGIKVDIYDAMPSVGRKFLMAGKGGMNISNAEPFDKLLSRYGTGRAPLETSLSNFRPEHLITWIQSLGIGTFVGSSGRVFPSDMKAAPLLRAWLHRLKTSGAEFHVRHQWLGWNDKHQLRFHTPSGEKIISADITILALGGASWSTLGSTGNWAALLNSQSVNIKPLKPANCGFDTNWSSHFIERCAGEPLKSVRITFTGDGLEQPQKGECVITQAGIEGGLIYSLSSVLRDKIDTAGSAVIYIDLTPDIDFASLLKKASLPRNKQSLANYLRKQLKLSGVKSALLHEVLSPAEFSDPIRLCETIKALPVKLISARPIDEAISSAGGVCFDELDENLMIKALPGVFCAGEMLDWEAPTGGYLLTACFATGHRAGLGALTLLNKSTH